MQLDLFLDGKEALLVNDLVTKILEPCPAGAERALHQLREQSPEHPDLGAFECLVHSVRAGPPAAPGAKQLGPMIDSVAALASAAERLLGREAAVFLLGWWRALARTEALPGGHDRTTVSLEALLEHAGGRGRLVEQPLRGRVDVAVQDLQLADEIEGVPLGFAERDARPRREHIGPEQRGDGMRIPLEERLLVAGHAHERVENARGVRIEIQHLADAAPVLEVKPAGVLEARDEAAGGVPQEGCLVLDAIERDVRALDAAGRWYAEQGGLDAETATAQVRRDLVLLRMQFDTLPQVTDDIDARNARFSGVALRKLMYLLRQDTRTEGQLQLLVDALARDAAPDLVFDVYRCELLTDQFLYTPPRRRARPAAQPLARRASADDGALRRQVVPRLRRPFARSRIDAFVDALLAGRASAPLSEAGPESDDEYVRLIYTVAYGLDGASGFRFEPDAATGEDRIERHGVYGFPRGAVVRRRRSRG